MKNDKEANAVIWKLSLLINKLKHPYREGLQKLV